MDNPFENKAQPEVSSVNTTEQTSDAAAEAELTPEQQEGLIIAENFELQRVDLMALKITEGPLTEEDLENMEFLKKVLAEFDDENF